ncbi:MAG TPA: tyrosine-protein phosphatase [Tepidisphaeraceae bacterium]|jgi:protein tyrosine/serine phosphatase
MSVVRVNRLLLALTLLLTQPLFNAGCASTPAERHTETIVLHPPQSWKDGPQHPLDTAVPGVPNFGLISRDVWRGGQPSAQGLEWLAKLGVKTVIDLREESDESTQIPSGIKYVRVPASQWHADNVNVREVLRAIDTSPKPVFIHCLQGRDRTGLAVAAYRLKQGMSAEQACTELENFHVNFWWDGPIVQRIHELDRLKRAG